VEAPETFKRRRRRAPELVHGLTETVELKDWDFAIILAALKVYAKEHHGGSGTYADNLAKRLRVPFSRLVRRTKRKRREIMASLHTAQLHELGRESGG